MVLRYDDTNNVIRSIGLISRNLTIYIKMDTIRKNRITLNSRSRRIFEFSKRYFLPVWNSIPYKIPKEMIRSIEKIIMSNLF